MGKVTRWPSDSPRPCAAGYYSPCHCLLHVHVATQAAGGGDIAGADIVHHHPVRREPPGERADRVHHHLDPPPRQPVEVPLVIGWDHFLLERLVEILAVALVADAVLDMLRA